MAVRAASHAGSWYSSSRPTLSAQLDQWLDQVPDQIQGVGPLPPARARVIIAPHAGYAYSGAAAAWAYRCLDLSKTKRIFLLGPSHHKYLSGCALTQCTSYATPLGDLSIDLATIKELHQKGKFDRMSARTDEDEHSLEMHLPYIYKVLSRTFSDPKDYPSLIPILVGNTTPSTERTYGTLLAPYLSDPSSIFVISSDFCHWGSRFSYTFYLPFSSSSNGTTTTTIRITDGYSLKPKDKPPSNPPIHESIRRLDELVMDGIETGSHDEFLEVLSQTGNTVCGRHPIGVVMAAMEVLRGRKGITKEEVDEDDDDHDDGRFRFVRYERNSDCVKVSDSSVSYASAFAVLRT